MDIALDFVETEIQSASLGDGLRTSILLSLYTDRFVDEDELDENKSNRGFWADSFEEIPHGSKLWTLQRQKITTEVLKKYKDYAKESLDWLLKDGIVDSISVEAEFSGTSIYCRVELERGDKSFKYKFDSLWKTEEERDVV
jgi:phage gp46-like protein